VVLWRKTYGRSWEKTPPPPAKGGTGSSSHKDEVGTICRRWNWKEADRTKLTQETQNAYLVIEPIPPVTCDTVETANREWADLVKQYCCGTVSTALLDKDNREIKLI